MVRDFAFYNAGVGAATGPRRLVVLARRLLRRLLRPMFFRQEEISRDFQAQLDALAERVEVVERQVQALHQRAATAEAFRWDSVAITRRLAAIEDHLRLGLDADPGGTAVRPAVVAPGFRLDGPDRARSPHPTSPFVTTRSGQDLDGDASTPID